MSFHVDLQIASDTTHLPKEEDFQLWVSTALQSKKKQAEVSIRIVDEDESQSLNAHYRGKDYPTNVLSFPAEFPEGVEVDFIGDLVICAPVVFREATEQSKSADAHWAHMVIHGCLHLIGYDHIEDDEAEVMESLETELLKTLGYSCPYKTISEVDGAGSHC